MASSAPTSTLVLRSNSRTLVLTTAILCALSLMSALPAQAQTFTVLHTFNGSDGEYPYTGVAITTGGALYGTTSRGGTYQGGVAYELKPSGSLWTFMLL